jgi:predicted nucleotidyltransferase
MVLDHIPARVRDIAAQAAAVLKAELPAGWRVIWFGSWAQGNAEERSDVDLGLLGPEPLTPLELGRLNDALDRIETLFKIDLVDLQAAGERFRTKAIREGIEL